MLLQALKFTDMDQKTKNKLKMYQAVKTICTQHQADWSSMPAFAQAFTQFSAKLNELDLTGYRQGIATLGVAANKDHLLQTTFALAETVSNGLRAYAAAQNDILLMGQLHFSKWDFKRNGTQSGLYLIDRVLDLAIPMSGLLGDCGITQQQIMDLQSMRLQLDDAVAMPRAAVIDRMQQTAAITAIQSDLDALLKNQLDPLAQVLQATQPGFYTNYCDARIILDYKGKTNDHGDIPQGPPPPTGPTR